MVLFTSGFIWLHLVLAPSGSICVCFYLVPALVLPEFGLSDYGSIWFSQGLVLSDSIWFWLFDKYCKSCKLCNTARCPCRKLDPPQQCSDFCGCSEHCENTDAPMPQNVSEDLEDDVLEEDFSEEGDD